MEKLGVGPLEPFVSGEFAAELPLPNIRITAKGREIGRRTKRKEAVEDAAIAYVKLWLLKDEE